MALKRSTLAAICALTLVSAPDVWAKAKLSCAESDAFRKSFEAYQVCSAELIAERNHLKQADLHAQIGEAYYWSWQYTQAIDEFNMALSLNPKLTETRIQRGWAFLRVGEPQKMFMELTDALTENPRSGRAVFGLGFLYQAACDREKAMAAFRQSLEFSPDYHLSRIFLADELIDNPDTISEGLSEYEILLRKGPKALNKTEFLTVNQQFDTQDFYAYVRFKRAKILMNLGRPEQALKDLDWLIRNYPQSPALIATKADLLNAQNQHDAALKLVSKARKLCEVGRSPYECDLAIAVHVETLVRLKQYRQAADAGRFAGDAGVFRSNGGRGLVMTAVAFKNLGDLDNAKRFAIMAIEHDNRYLSRLLSRLISRGFYSGGTSDSWSKKVEIGLEACLMDDECYAS